LQIKHLGEQVKNLGAEVHDQKDPVRDLEFSLRNRKFPVLDLKIATGRPQFAFADGKLLSVDNNLKRWRPQSLASSDRCDVYPAERRDFFDSEQLLTL